MAISSNLASRVILVKVPSWLLNGRHLNVISVCTSTYNNSPDELARVWASLKSQTYKDWVWTVYDDSTDPTVWANLYGFCADERYKVEMFKPHVPSRGNIGLSKHNCFMLAKGDLLVELDADDEITPDALTEIAQAFQDPTIGFVYSDWCEILPTGESGRYPDGWAFGYGNHYWDTEHQVWAMQSPEINHTTLSHIVSAPNHVRVWRADVYRKLGGHDIRLEVADDFDLVVRTCAVTRTHHIPKMLYKQHIGAHSAQRQRNALIQQLVPEIRQKHPEFIFGLNS